MIMKSQGGQGREHHRSGGICRGLKLVQMIANPLDVVGAWSVWGKPAEVKTEQRGRGELMEGCCISGAAFFNWGKNLLHLHLLKINNATFRCFKMVSY